MDADERRQLEERILYELPPPGATPRSTGAIFRGRTYDGKPLPRQEDYEDRLAHQRRVAQALRSLERRGLVTVSFRSKSQLYERDYVFWRLVHAP